MGFVLPSYSTGTEAGVLRNCKSILLAFQSTDHVSIAYLPTKTAETPSLPYGPFWLVRSWGKVTSSNANSAWKMLWGGGEDIAFHRR